MSYENLSLEDKVQRLLDIQEIRNLMSRYEYYGFNNQPDKIIACFASRDDVYVDCEGIGILDGPAGIRKFFKDWHKDLIGDPKGIFGIHAVCTEIIEVAEDGKTARGLWISPGAEAKRRAEDNALESYWIWGKYAVDFIRENGVWKFWRFRIPHDLLCDFHHSWTELAELELGEDMASNNLKPKGDRPSSYGRNYYSATRPANDFFEPPVPYQTEADLDGFWGEPYHPVDL